MISHDTFPVEPWCIRETRFDPTILAQTESLFALSNGHIGIRGNFDEGEPNGLPGTYLNGFFESRPLPYAEAGYGYPESGQSIVNVTNGKLIRLLVDDEPFDLRYGEVVSHSRCLNLQTGTLERETVWRSPAGAVVKIASTRLVSLQQRAVMAVSFRVTPLDGPARIIVQSELVANEEMPELSEDPRVAAALSNPLEAEQWLSADLRALLIHRTKGSRLRMAAAMDHTYTCDAEVATHGDAQPDWARATFVTSLEADQTLRIDKLVAYGWSAGRTLPAVRDQVDGALSGARTTGWDGLLAEQRAVLDDFWDSADVVIEGDEEVQQAARFALWQVLQAGIRAEQRAIPAKGLTGDGYDGHSFWDAEMFLLPVLTWTRPDAAADFLRWRHSTLPMARERAAQLGFKGAAFPWRTIRGEECSAYWPAGSAALHIGADIAVATQRVLHATPDAVFDRNVASDMLIEIARFFISAGHFCSHGLFHLDGVTGPDEYSSIADDNIYTNLMARRALRFAADAAERVTEQAHELAVTPEEIAHWRKAADVVAVPFDEELGVHSQSEGFTGHEVWDFAACTAEDYPLLLHRTYFDLYRKQVVKQADLVLALHWCGDEFTFEQKSKDLDYYEPITVRDSSLSACTQAIVCAEVGHRDLALDYLKEAALIDLRDLQHNTKDGLHLASLAGTWLALAAGFGGLRDHGGSLSFAPALPPGWTRLQFAVRWQGLRLRIDVTTEGTTYLLRDGGKHTGMTITHHGQELDLQEEVALEVPNPEVVPLLPRPTQPPGRGPLKEVPGA